MIILVLISVIALMLVLGGGAAVWFVSRQRQAVKSQESIKETTGAALAFRWVYIIGPLVILLLSIILVAIFYSRLPVEVAYHFKSDGSADRWLAREMIILWVLLPQLFLTLLAGAMVWGIGKLGTLFSQPVSTEIKPGGILLVAGNMIALPQIVLCFAMLDIFSYNSYQMHIMPLWIFALIVMGVGGIFLGIFFIRTMWRVLGATR